MEGSGSVNGLGYKYLSTKVAIQAGSISRHTWIKWCIRMISGKGLEGLIVKQIGKFIMRWTRKMAARM